VPNLGKPENPVIPFPPFKDRLQDLEHGLLNYGSAIRCSTNLISQDWLTSSKKLWTSTSSIQFTFVLVIPATRFERRRPGAAAGCSSNRQRPRSNRQSAAPPHDRGAEHEEARGEHGRSATPSRGPATI
jgi:hypothetical protein